MNHSQAIYWHQGMFLQPQHFQQAEQHQRFQLSPLLESGLPHFWGVGRLDLPPSALANRTVEIRNAQLVFPDGTYIDYPGNAVIKPRTLNANGIEGDKPNTVYLGLKKLLPREINVTEAASLQEAGDASTRFASLANPQETADLYAEGPTAQVRTLLHVVRIFFEHEIEHVEQYDLIPIARLVRDGEAMVLSPNFIPPCYTLAGAEPLSAMIRDIRDELAGRARQLQEYKSPREMQKAEFDSSYLVFLLALRSLNRITPYLFHLTETRQAHPWQVYGTLRQLVGELSSFSERFDMLGEAEDGTPGLPPYDHGDLGKCFGRVRSLISHLLNEITVGPEFLAILTYQDGCYRSTLPRDFFGQRNRFYLVVRTEADPLRVVEALQSEARLAAEDELPQLIAHALPGLELIHMPLAPQGLPRRASSYYFRIEQQSRQWEAVERDGSIALYWLDAPDDLKAEIVVLGR